MSKGVLEYVGMFLDQRSGEQKPHFKKASGGQWALSPGQINWSQFQPGKLYVEWENWTATKATTELPQKKGGFKSQPYHPETFVSNVVGSAIQAGAIKQPAQLREWAAEAFIIVKGMQAPPEQKTAQNPPPTGNNSGYNESNPLPYNDDIPW